MSTGEHGSPAIAAHRAAHRKHYRHRDRGSRYLRYPGGYLSVDVKDGKVIPSGDSPVAVLRAARKWNFEGCIILNLGFVGTENGLGPAPGRSKHGGLPITAGCSTAAVLHPSRISKRLRIPALTVLSLRPPSTRVQCRPNGSEGMLLLVTIEGIDGTGKSTLLAALKKRLE